MTRQIERRLAPFFKGLNEHSASWNDHQLVAATKGRPIPAADEVPPNQQADTATHAESLSDPADDQSDTLAIPIATRSTSQNSDTPSDPPSSNLAFSQPLPFSPLGSPANSSSSPFRPRSKTVATLTGLSRHNNQGDITPSEVHLPKESHVDGRLIGAFLYKEASECPICFLYYPPYLNRTRCCDQPICSECFVQIKRPDPHPPEHTDPASPSVTNSERQGESDGTLISEPASCPFCVQPEFGITYEPPPFRSGLAYTNQSPPQPLGRMKSAMSSSSSLSSGSANGSLPSPTFPSRRRTTSLSVNDANVITTDKVRPDWAQKLASAKAQAARRSAAATALHTAAYLMGGGGTEPRGFSGFSRRGRLMQTRLASGDPPNGGPVAGSINFGGMSSVAAMSDRNAGQSARRDGRAHDEESPDGENNEAPARRSRMDDLEEMMMMEAIRLSLASEEERKKKEDKEAKKEAKKKEKEMKKGEKAPKKGVQQGDSTDHLPIPSNGSRTGDSSPQREVHVPGKGKKVDRGEDLSLAPARRAGVEDQASTTRVPGVSVSQADTTERQPTPAQPVDPSHSPSHLNSDGYRPSHLRHVSNTSSSASSFIESGPASVRNDLQGSNSSFEPSPNASGTHVGREEPRTKSSTPPTGGTSLEPLFNFQSLAAMIGRDEQWADSEHVENGENGENGKGMVEYNDTKGAITTSCAANAHENEKEATSQNKDTRHV